MIKVAMIGAGSVVFSKNLTGDILSHPEFKDATFSYMDIDADRLEVGAALCRKVGKTLGANPTIEATTDRRKALEGADFVINMVQIGGFDSTLVDFEIPRKYGLNFTIADTTGPGGLFRALRTYPMLKGMVEDMMEVCPRAVLLNYSNPMSMNMQTIYRNSNIQAVGLCHSVQGTFNQIMRNIGEDPNQVAFVCAGINHMAFYLKIEKDGVDLYPRLFEASDDPKVFGTNKVRYELMRKLGYFVTESSEHNAEYNAHFIPHGKDVIDRYDVPIDEYLRRCDGIVDEFERLKKFSRTDEPMEFRRSHEYGSTIIHSIVTGTPSVVYGNMPNKGAITNLPDTAIAEVPTLVDRAGCSSPRSGSSAAARRLHVPARHPARAVHPGGDGGAARPHLPGGDVRPADGGDAEPGPDRRDVRRVDRRARRVPSGPGRQEDAGADERQDLLGRRPRRNSGRAGTPRRRRATRTTSGTGRSSAPSRTATPASAPSGPGYRGAVDRRERPGPVCRVRRRGTPRSSGRT
jgi:alpha-galactosidase